jgi:tetrahydromethanopterin S-methyltransferase subunit D
MPAFTLVALFSGLLLVPVTLYLYWAHDAWSWLYLVDPAEVPELAVIPVVVVVAGATLAGWYVGALLVRADLRPALTYATGGVAAVLVLGLVLLRARLGAYGAYGDFHDGRAHDLMEVKLGYVLVVLLLALFGAAAVVALELVRDSRRVRAR